MRKVYDRLTRKFWLLAFRLMPIKKLSYIAGFIYANQNTLGSKFIFRLVAGVVGMNFQFAPEILNQRLASMKSLTKKEATKLVWSASTTSAWNSSHFSHPEERSKQFVYQATKSIADRLGRPISVLELGSVAGGSFTCLMHLDIEVSNYVGVDISRKAILEGRSRFKDVPSVGFIEGDLLEVSRSLSHQFDILIVNLTFLFLEESYLKELFQELSRITDRIVISEKELPDQVGQPSRVGNWGNSPIDYSHDYESLLNGAGFRVESGGIVDFYNPYNSLFSSSTKLKSEAVLFEAILRGPN